MFNATTTTSRQRSLHLQLTSNKFILYRVKMIRRRNKGHLLLISMMSVVTATVTNSTVDEISSIFILPSNRLDENINNRNGNDQPHRNNTEERINIVGNLETAENAVFQVSPDVPPRTMQKTLSFQDNMFDNEIYEYTSFQIDATGESLNIMSITGADGIRRFVG